MANTRFDSMQTVLDAVYDESALALRTTYSGAVITTISGSVTATITDTVNVLTSDSLGVYTISPTVSLTAYSGGDLVGTKVTLSNVCTSGTGVIMSAVVYDRDAQNPSIDLVVFNEDPTNTTFTDNAVFSVANADLDKICAVLPVAAWFTFNGNSVGLVTGAELPFTTSNNDLYVGVVVRSTPTFTTTSGFSIKLSILSI